MSNTWFRFKQFTVHQDRCAMKVTTDACLFGAWVADNMRARIIPGMKVLDIGAGTGLLSLMLLQQYPELSLTAIEIDEAAVTQARENAAATPWNKHIRIIHSDVKAYVQEHRLTFDTVISNPPFYETELHSPDPQRNMAHHSGGLSLEELFRTISRVTDPSGRFYVLLPYKRKEEIVQVIRQSGLAINQWVNVRHSAAHPFNRIFIEGSPGTSTSYATTVISIHEPTKEYSPTFKNLLRAYYLHI